MVWTIRSIAHCLPPVTGTPPPQRFVNGNHGCDRTRLAGGETVLRFQQGAFGVQHAQKIRDPAFVTLMREVGCL